MDIRADAAPAASGLQWRFSPGQRGSSVRIEVLAGITSFLAAAYLMVVIPSLLAAGGIDRGAATTATILVFVFATVFMGLYADMPFLVGPGIGGSVLVGPTMAATGHIPWQVGLGIAFWSSLLFVLMTVLGLRQVIARMVPAQIKLALGAAIGLFIAVLGFKNAGLVGVNARTNSLMLGSFATPQALVALFGLFFAVFLRGRRVPGAILWSILGGTLLGIPLGVTKLPTAYIGLPSGIDATFLHLDVIEPLSLRYFPYLFAFFASEFFSTLGTTLAVGAKAGLVDEDGNMENIGRPFVVDSIAATISPLLGIPSATALVESATGAEAGGRTGLTALAAAALFALMLLFTPVALMIPAAATAPALILVGLSMFGALRRVDLDNFTDGLAAVLMVLLTLLSNSFGTGIAGGMLAYVIIKVLAGEGRAVSVGMYVMALPLAYYFWTVVGH
jgi:AGZA family xanthine/uracil permease-like MFS transporter